jgi:hypothetical protein
MADVSYSQNLGDGSYAQAAPHAPVQSSNQLTNLTNLAAAGVSLALMAGVAVWGYKLMVRDVSGIPVVQASSGDMRVRPQDPGGQLAINQGLAVNEVAAAGSAAAPAQSLTLAPRPVDLTQEDMPTPVAMVAPVQQSLPQVSAPDALPVTQPEPLDVAAALEAGSVEDLVRQLAAGAEAIEAEPTTNDPAVLAAVTPTTPEAMPTHVVINAPGVKVSYRPKLRPAGLRSAVTAAVQSASGAAVTPVAARSTGEISAATIPAGTRLVQLGAFDSPEVARAQWVKLEARFGDYLYGKSRVVQKAQSGGRTFYRLRAMGFDDLSDARRFCSALLAEKADCIPVVTR